MFYLTLKFLFFFLLIALFLSFFGIPSLLRYLEKRYIFFDEKVDFDLNKPPAILVYHLPWNEKRNGNYAEIIQTCINKSEEYKKSIACVNENLPDKNEIIHNNQMSHFNRDPLNKTEGRNLNYCGSSLSSYNEV